MKISSIVRRLAIVLVFGSWITAICAQERPSGLSLKLEAVPETEYSTRYAPLRITFVNIGGPDQRILNIFDRVGPERVFFTFQIWDRDTPVGMFGGGKISIPLNGYKYATLKEGEELRLDVDLKRFFPRDFNLAPGTYRVRVKYFNQYGENCFRGALESNPIDLDFH